MAVEIYAVGSKVKVNGSICKVIEPPTNVNAVNFSAFYKVIDTWTKNVFMCHNKHVTAFNQYELQKNFYDILK